MSSVRKVRLLIIGGGCAGLSLARELADRGWSESTLIIEPRSAYSNDRSWCFWADQREPLTRLASARWARWRFSTADGRQIDHQVPGLHYHFVASDDFYRDAISRMKGQAKIELQLDTRFESSRQFAGQFHVDTSRGPIIASEVIDTRPPEPERTQRSSLFQCFAGQILRVDHPPAGLDGTAELMGTMRSDAAGLTFDYVLPLDQHRVLIEATRFAPAPVSSDELTEDLDQLRFRLGYADCPSEHDEAAILPMGLPLADTTDPAGWIRAGTGGGALRPSTGYAFLRIQRWARTCADRLIDGQTAIAHPPDSRLQSWMDRLFLAVARRHPELTAELFMRMALGVRPAVLTRFLSDQAALTDRLAIASTLPLRPFLAQLARAT